MARNGGRVNFRQESYLNYHEKELLKTKSRLGAAEFELDDSTQILENLVNSIVNASLSGNSIEIHLIASIIRKLRNK